MTEKQTQINIRARNDLKKTLEDSWLDYQETNNIKVSFNSYLVHVLEEFVKSEAR